LAAITIETRLAHYHPIYFFLPLIHTAALARATEYAFPLPRPAAPPQQDADPLSPTHTRSAIEFVLVLNYWL